MPLAAAAPFWQADALWRWVTAVSVLTCGHICKEELATASTDEKLEGQPKRPRALMQGIPLNLVECAEGARPTLADVAQRHADLTRRLAQQASSLPKLAVSLSSPITRRTQKSVADSHKKKWAAKGQGRCKASSKCAGNKKGKGKGKGGGKVGKGVKRQVSRRSLGGKLKRRASKSYKVNKMATERVMLWSLPRQTLCKP